MAKGGVSLFAKGAVDPALDQLFSTSLSKEPLKAAPIAIQESRKPIDDDESSEVDDELQADDKSASDADNDDDDDEDSALEIEDEAEDDESSGDEIEAEAEQLKEPEKPRKKRKRGDDADLEEKYLAKLSRIAEADEKRSKRQKSESGKVVENDSANEDEEGSEAADAESAESDFEIPKHETQDGSDKKGEIDQANRTVFVGNVSTDAIKSKDSFKILKAHMVSFLDKGDEERSQQQIESIRFRSIAFASTALPRKAAFAKKDLMDATTKSTNAYVVYSTPALAKAAIQKLNGTIILDRHIRVDSVAHPAAIDHRRCVFVGNLGFVDDESLMQENGDDDKPKKKKKQPGDVEEGLWRQFSKAGTVESVRVIRDKSTRVGKGFAYVQFTDQVAVEKALEFNEKKFPPMLPRILRVTRAKKITKTNAYKEKQGKGRALAETASNGKVYNPKITPEAQTAKGRATKMFGRAGAAQLKKGKRGETDTGIRGPESSVFEGHRARDAEGKGTMKLKQKQKQKGGKPQTRSSRRGAAFKAAGKKK